VDAPWTRWPPLAIAMDGADIAICLHLMEALYRTRTDDPFLTMEVLYQLS
jgi:hypothetical protein